MLLQLQERTSEIEAEGAGTIAVSVAAAHQAQWLAEERGITFPLLLDAEGNLRDALQFGRMGLWRYLLPSTWWRYFKGWGSARQGRITGNPTEVPGIVIVDTDGTILYRHEGRALGDYPPLDEVLDALRGTERR